MRFIFILFVFLGITAFGQKSPIGLILQFEENTDFAAQAEILNPYQEFNSLKKNHLLKGFGVTLVEGSGQYTVEQYKAFQQQIEKNDEIVFTSILYKTPDGGVGGDLPQMYYKFKENPPNPYYYRLPKVLPKITNHHYLKGVKVASYSKYCDDIRTVQEEMTASGNFEFVSVNTLHTVLATVDDPYFENQWALENEGTALHYDGTPGADMSVVEAWEFETGSPDIKIAILDSGTDTNHIDLKDNLLPGFDATGGGSEGFPNTEYSNDGHGTCTAGIVAAIGNNEEGIAGVAYDCKIIPVKIFYYVEFGGDVIPFTTSSAGQDGIIWAVNEAKADILSNSWGLRDSDIPLLGIDTVMGNMVIAENVQNGREGKGTPMLFSSGNEGDSFSIWPASHPKTISVGASTMCDELKWPTDCSPEGWWGSNHGDNLDVTAPGVKVLATDMMDDLGYNGFMDNNYSMFNGTSAACPNAAGVMALVLSTDPELTSFEARAVLSITADKVGDYDYDTAGDFGEWSEEMGYGRVNAYAAVFYASNFVGIEEVQSTSDYIAYNDFETILMLDGFENAEVSVYNLQGQTLVIFNAGELGKHYLSLNEFISTTGIYLVKVKRGVDEVILKAAVKK